MPWPTNLVYQRECLFDPIKCHIIMSSILFHKKCDAKMIMPTNHISVKYNRRMIFITRTCLPELSVFIYQLLFWHVPSSVLMLFKYNTNKINYLFGQLVIGNRDVYEVICLLYQSVIQESLLFRPQAQMIIIEMEGCVTNMVLAPLLSAFITCSIIISLH